jgi:hypothetical protein
MNHKRLVKLFYRSYFRKAIKIGAYKTINLYGFETWFLLQGKRISYTCLETFPEKYLALRKDEEEN